MDLSNNIGYLLQHLAFSMARQNDLLLQRQFGLGFSQFKILMVLEKSPYIQQRQIAEALGQTEASISRQIKLMTADGLLQRSRGGDRRQHITMLTAKGVKLVENAYDSLNLYHKPMFERLDHEQQSVLKDALLKMHECACMPGKAGSCDRPYRG